MIKLLNILEIKVISNKIDPKIVRDLYWDVIDYNLKKAAHLLTSYEGKVEGGYKMGSDMLINNLSEEDLKDFYLKLLNLKK